MFRSLPHYADAMNEKTKQQARHWMSQAAPQLAGRLSHDPSRQQRPQPPEAVNLKDFFKNSGNLAAQIAELQTAANTLGDVIEDLGKSMDYYETLEMIQRHKGKLHNQIFELQTAMHKQLAHLQTLTK